MTCAHRPNHGQCDRCDIAFVLVASESHYGDIALSVEELKKYVEWHRAHNEQNICEGKFGNIPAEHLVECAAIDVWIDRAAEPGLMFDWYEARVFCVRNSSWRLKRGRAEPGNEGLIEEIP